MDHRSGANVGYTAAFLASRFPRRPGLRRGNGPRQRRPGEAEHAMLRRPGEDHRGGGLSPTTDIATSRARKPDAFRVVRPGAEETAPPSAAPRQVRAMTMKSILRCAGMAWADYVKVDIEGAEDELFLSTSPGWWSAWDRSRWKSTRPCGAHPACWGKARFCLPVAGRTLELPDGGPAANGACETGPNPAGGPGAWRNDALRAIIAPCGPADIRVRAVEFVPPGAFLQSSFTDRSAQGWFDEFTDRCRGQSGRLICRCSA